VITAYLLARNGSTGAGIFAFSQGLLIDTFSVGLLGLYTSLYVIVFLGIGFGSRFFDIQSTRGQIIVITLAVVLKEIFFVIILNVVALEVVISPSSVLGFATSAICSGLVAPFLFVLLSRIDNFLEGMAGLSDELI
jgi:rod shape-determining protein MreD